MFDRSTLVILVTGSPPSSIVDQHGAFDSWIQRRIGDAWHGRFAVLDVRTSPPPREVLGAAGVVLTGSSSSVTERAPWMLAIETWLAEAVHGDVLPVLGICFGHQLLAQALGGLVTKNPRGREIGTIRVTQRPAPANDATATTSKNEGVAHAPDPILDGLDATFLVNATHVDTVAELPPGATILASTSLEPTAVFRVGRAWGVQFHPEIDRAAMRAYLTVRRPVLEPEGLDVDALLDAADECTAGARILQNFCAHVRTTR